MNLTCYQCGQAIKGPALYRGERRQFMPVFCSESCADSYRPDEMNKTKWRGLQGWINALQLNRKP